MSRPPFTAGVRDEERMAVLDLRGEINAFSEHALQTAFAEAEALDPQAIGLNFEAVRYINSTGIALIVSLLARARQAKRPLLVFGLSDHYTEIFQITRLADLMQIYPDENSVLP